MQKPQSTLQTPQIRPNHIKLATLRQNNRSSLSHYDTKNQAKPNQTVLTGALRFQSFDEGFSVHGGEFEEQASIENRFDMPACISINWLFEGELQFGVNNRVFTLCAQPNTLQCAAITSNDTVTVIRPMREKNHIKKLNVFASKEWLLNNVTSTQEAQHLHHIFSRDRQVLQWTASEQCHSLANQLLNALVQHEAGFHERSLALQLLAESLNNIRAISAATNEPQTFAIDQQLKLRVQQLNNQGYNLKNIADTFNMSPSNLQRRFKKQYGVTAADFLKQTKLEEARKAIVSGSLTIGEASHNAGYKHTANFIAAFKKYYGATPKTLRDNSN